MKKIFKQNKGFSMMELLVVVLIIGILAAVMVPSYEKAGEKGKVVEAASGIRGIEIAARERLMPSMRFFTVNSINQIKPALSVGEMQGNNWVTKNWTFSITGNTSSWTITAQRNTGDYSLTSVLSPGSNNAGVSVSHNCNNGGTSTGRYVCKYLQPKGWKS